MPKQYEAIRDEFIRQGKPTAEAKTRAAKIYNAKRKPGQRPVTGHHADTLGDVVTGRRSKR